MSARIRLLSRLGLACVAVAVLGGCAHRHGEMTPPAAHAGCAQDARLVELVAAMNAAEGPAKVDAIAAVVSELSARSAHPHRCMHKPAGAQGCGCPACPHAAQGGDCPACPHAGQGCGGPACPHATQGPGTPACPHGSGPCPMKTQP